ncbi:MAG TPA: DegV family protein [Mycobacteriales bacterium]|jgi:DegV family protein with EDD domain|nr:DegV family protein [Mycobacteriales bacterium]
MSGTRRVAVVTDSTAYLPEGIAEKYDVRVIPLQVVIGGRVGAEGLDVHPADVAEALRSRRAPVSTSRPSPEQFARAYADLAAAGYEAAVSVHLSAALSGTVDAARMAAAHAPLPVQVLDSRSTAMGLGFAVLAAAEAADSGADAGTVAGEAAAAAARTDTLFYVDTLEHLRRGGRIGRAAAMLGSALAVKPILHVDAGEIAPLEKVRTASRGLTRLQELVVDRAGDSLVDVAVHHLAAPARADVLVERIRSAVPRLRHLYVAEVGAAIGAHVGPGLLAVVVSRAADPQG